MKALAWFQYNNLQITTVKKSIIVVTCMPSIHNRTVTWSIRNYQITLFNYIYFGKERNLKQYGKTNEMSDLSTIHDALGLKYDIQL